MGEHGAASRATPPRPRLCVHLDRQEATEVDESAARYNEHRFFNPNPLNRYSLGTKNKNLERGADGSLTRHAGAKSSGPENESNWLPAPDGPFPLYIRAYWGDEAITGGTWQPPAVEAV